MRSNLGKAAIHNCKSSLVSNRSCDLTLSVKHDVFDESHTADSCITQAQSSCKVVLLRKNASNIHRDRGESKPFSQVIKHV